MFRPPFTRGSIPKEKPLKPPKPSIGTGTAVMSDYAIPLAVATFQRFDPLTFIKEGEMWILSSATIYADTNIVGGVIRGFYGALGVRDPSRVGGVTAANGPLWRTRIGIDEANLQIPVFHGSDLILTAFDVLAATDTFNYYATFVKVR